LPSESLWESINAAGTPPGRLYGIRHVVPLAELAHATGLGGRLEELRDRSIVLLAKDQLTAALALIELDGVARRIVLCPPDLSSEHLPAVVRDAEADASVVDERTATSGLGIPTPFDVRPDLTRSGIPRRRSRDTEWVLLTSGTTGVPKLVLHTLESLTSALPASARAPAVRS